MAGGEALLLITCEHAGKRVPRAYRSLFEGQAALLDTHRGWDPGALTLAREMASAFDAPLFYSQTTRLMIDLNRSIGNPALYSEFTRPLPVAARRLIATEHHASHHAPIHAWVRARMDEGRRVVHVASHSFTPELNGQVRRADVGLLYDPARPGEVNFSNGWLAALRAARLDLRLRRNYPYLGNSDGLALRLRRLYPAEAYIGIELEVNQRYVRQGGPRWTSLRRALLAALRRALTDGPFDLPTA